MDFSSIITILKGQMDLSIIQIVIGLMSCSMRAILFSINLHYLKFDPIITTVISRLIKLIPQSILISHNNKINHNPTVLISSGLDHNKTIITITLTIISYISSNISDNISDNMNNNNEITFINNNNQKTTSITSSNNIITTTIISNSKTTPITRNLITTIIRK